MAGGHLGFKKEQINNPEYTLQTLVDDVRAVVQPFEQHFGRTISVIAAGGIYTGEDISDFIKRGAHGVQMATRFVATHECDAHMRFKQAYLNTQPGDLTIIDSPVGLPGRAINNGFLQDVAEGIKKPFSCPWKCLRTCDFKNAPYCIGNALAQAKLGNLDHGFVFAGTNAWRVDEIISVEELMQTLAEEYQEACEYNVAVA